VQPLRSNLWVRHVVPVFTHVLATQNPSTFKLEVATLMCEPWPACVKHRASDQTQILTMIVPKSGRNWWTEPTTKHWFSPNHSEICEMQGYQLKCKLEAIENNGRQMQMFVLLRWDNESSQGPNHEDNIEKTTKICSTAWKISRFQHLLPVLLTHSSSKCAHMTTERYNSCIPMETR
jgi:hypothetical protein